MLRSSCFRLALLAFPVAGLLVASVVGQEPRQRLPEPAGIQAALTNLPHIPPPEARAVQVPNGFTVQVVAADLTYPTSITFDNGGRMYVAEAGLTQGDDRAPGRILRITPNGTRAHIDVVADEIVRPVKDVLWRDGRLLVAHANRIGIVADGKVRDVVTDLPRSRAGLMPRHGRDGMDIAPAGAFGKGMMFVAMAGDTALTADGHAEHPVFGVVRINPDTLHQELFFGARNDALGPVGFEHVATAGPRRPVDCRFGPDGALYVVDFGAVAMEKTATGPMAHPIRGTGVIWRIAPTGHEVLRPAIVDRPAGIERPVVVQKPALVVDTAVAAVGNSIIRGIVMEGELLQPDILVELLDTNGNVIATKTTRPNGSFEFRDVPAGSYKLFSVKGYSLAHGGAAVIAAPGKVTDALVQIVR